MAESQLRTGCPTIDDLIGGGLRRGELVQIYGEGGAGKTNIVAATAVHSAANGNNVIVISEDETTYDRVLSFAESHPDATEEEITVRLLFNTVSSFREQKDAIVQIRENFADSHDIVLVDGIGRYYRIERGKEESDSARVEREFTRQITLLRALARKHDMAAVITNQVYYQPDEDKIKPLGGAGMEDWFDAMLLVQSVDGDRHNVYLEKHRHEEEGGRAWFRITGSGLEPCE